MFLFDVLLPAFLLGGLLAYFSETIAHFFAQTGSHNLIRGLDNPWTYKTLGFVIAFGYPLLTIAQAEMIQTIGS